MILAELRLVLPDLVHLTTPGGTLICSGLLNGQLPEWKAELGEQEGWAAVMFQHLAK